MKIAVTYEDGMVFQHFGHTQQFKLYEVENGAVQNEQVVDTQGSGHGALAGFLTQYDVDTLLCGGIGGGAQNALAAAGIQLYGGISGNADEAVSAFLAGTLAYNPDVHCGHHEHGHDCGAHSCGEKAHIRKKENLTMELANYFKSIIDEDRCAVVICNLSHEILYMNPAAVARYEKRGGQALIGQSLLDCHNTQSAEMIKKVVLWFGECADHNRIYTFYNEKENKDVYMVALREADGTLIGYYEKHEYRNKETAKRYDFSVKI